MFGTFRSHAGEPRTLSSNGIWSFVEDVVFKVLVTFGVCCERVTLKGLKTEDLRMSLRSCDCM